MGVGLLALLGIVSMTIWLGERSQVYVKEVTEARDLRIAAVELRNALQTAEASERGFLITGNEIYLSPYGVAKSQAYRHLSYLSRTLSTNRQSEVLLRRLTTLLDEKFVKMDETIRLKSERKHEEAVALFRGNRGKALMDEANVFLSGIILAADERLSTGVDEQRVNANRLRWASIFGGLVIIVVVGGASLTVLNYTREIVRTRDEVRLLNAGLEERVRKRTAELARINEEVQRFAYIVTHDLRAPLVNIMGFTSEVERGVGSVHALMLKTKSANQPGDPVADEAHAAVANDIPEAIGFIRSSTKKMDSLINAILRLSREGRRQLRPERLDLRKLIESSISAIQHQLLEATGEAKLKLAAASIVTDRLALEQVLGNLLDNAVKFRQPDRRLLIEVRTRNLPGSRFALEVADNGRGIAEKDLERVFELFRRAGVQDQPGDGIGLAHVRSVVRNLGGDITVTSKLGEGTTFRVELPNHLSV